MKTLPHLVTAGLLALLLLAGLTATSAKAAPPPHIVFIVGDHEYGSERTMPLLAQALSTQYGFKTTVLKSVPDEAGNDIPGLEALDTADLAIFFLRWRALPAQQIQHVEAYAKSGRPMIGFRTSSHSFKYPEGDPLEKWNGWAAEAFGAPPGWGADGHTHYGHQCSTDVSIIPAAAKEPILKGATGSFHVRSWLYQVLPKWPPADATRLLSGKAVDPNKPAPDNPVAWTWKNKFGGRIFFTTLGHPEDFSVEPFQRLVLNAVYWTLGQPVPDTWKGRMDINVSYEKPGKADAKKAEPKKAPKK